VDPYIGVGTAAIAAYIVGRRSAGADTEGRYLEIARERLRKAQTSTLKIRPMNQPVYEPDPRMAVARLPEEWSAGQIEEQLPGE
jgi:adenine-specific DNA-methyltransferase